MSEMKSAGKSTILWLYRYIKPYKGWFLVNILCLFANTAINIASARFIQQLVQNAVDGKDTDILFRNIITLSIFVITGIGVTILSVYSNGRYGNPALKDIKEHLAAHIGELTVLELDSSHSGDMVSRVNNDMNQITNFIKSSMTRIIYLPVMGISASIYMIVLNPKLFLVCFLLTPFILYFTNRFRQKVNGLAFDMYEYLGKANGVIQDMIGGIAIIKAFQIEKALFKKCCRHLDASLKKGFGADKYATLSIFMSIILYEMPNLLCLVFGGLLAFNGEITLGEYVVFVQLIWYVIEPAASVPGMLLSISLTQSSISRVGEIFSKPVERKSGSAFKPKESTVQLESKGLKESRESKKTKEILHVDHIDFSYRNGNRVLRGLNFSIEEGRTYALVGSSGSGKSTVIKLINGFYEADRGEIKLYGNPYGEWNLGKLRENFGVVSQDVYLFPDTIWNNIAYGKPDATEEEIITAARAAYADEFIQELPEGYRTIVGERGNLLSGGQKQRISIARAILKNAPILLLDEPTSALDYQSEKFVRKALDEFMQGRTTIVVAHRMSTIMNSDAIFVMENGQIVETGTHDELIAVQGVYHHLYERQFSGGMDSCEEVV